MKVILVKDVPKLGRRFDIKEVNSGYATNFLIPKGLVVSATPDAVKKLEAERTKSEGERKVQEELLVKNLEALENVTVTIPGKANDKGHLFAAIHAEIIAKELERQAHIEILPSFLVMEHPLKEIGEHTIEVKTAGKAAKFKVIVVRD